MTNLAVALSPGAVEMKGVYKFLPPKSVKLVGSFPLGTCNRSNLNVDVVLEIPKVRTYYVWFYVKHFDKINAVV